MAQNLAASFCSSVADVEAALAAIADDCLAFNLRPAARTISAREAVRVVDIVSTSVIIYTREFRWAS